MTAQSHAPREPEKPRYRIWSEHEPFERVGSREVRQALVRSRVQPLVAVRPSMQRGIADLILGYREAGGRLGLWPMLEDADGRWANAHNGEAYCEFVHELLRGLRQQGALPDTLAIDLEPPIASVRSVMAGWPLPLLAPMAQEPPGSFAAPLVSALARDGVESLAAVVPFLLWDRSAGGGWERAMGTPIARVPFDRVSPMVYTSLLRGYSRGLLRRQDVVSLVVRASQMTRARWGEGASLSLGAVGSGALGDEPTYDSPDELAEDVRAALFAGVDDLCLFDLGGALARPPLQKWLDALTTPSRSRTPPPRTRRSGALSLCMHTASRGLGWLGWALDRRARNGL